MIIQKDDPALQFLYCYDRDDEPLQVSAFDMSIQMGAWKGSSIPVSRYEFVVPNEEVLEAIQEYLGTKYASKAYIAGNKPKKKKRPAPRAPGINPGGGHIPYGSFVRVGEE